MPVLISLMIATIFVGVYFAFLFSLAWEKKPKPSKFAGAGVGEKATKPKQYNG